VRFANKVAIVTASAGAGIGQATAHAFAREGANVVVSDLNKDRLAKIVTEMNSEYKSKILGIACDVTNPQQVEDMVKEIVKEFDSIDILVNNAGIDISKPLVEMTDEEWDLIINVNLRGTFNCSRAVLPIMMKAKKGRVINLSSASGLTHTTPSSAVYSAAKAGIVGLTKGLARDVADYNITVNAIAPGPTLNPFLSRISPPGFWDNLAKGVPLGRLGAPEDIANSILFLASDDASYITGSTLCVSGGSHMH
jgi:3-oxoacyl-[acyl-carrier protein] reductase